MIAIPFFTLIGFALASLCPMHSLDLILLIKVLILKTYLCHTLSKITLQNYKC